MKHHVELEPGDKIYLVDKYAEIIEVILDEDHLKSLENVAYLDSWNAICIKDNSFKEHEPNKVYEVDLLDDNDDITLCTRAGYLESDKYVLFLHETDALSHANNINIKKLKQDFIYRNESIRMKTTELNRIKILLEEYGIDWKTLI